MQDNTANSRREVSGPKGGVYIMRIATVMLAIVSWWATAQGMRNYVFSEEWQANLASLAVQSILLGLNFYWPTFWRESKTKVRKLGLLLLSAIVLFCSSWFSYVFIVDRVYEQAWSTDCQLLVQRIYREELYSASDYADAYEKALREQLTNQIILLYDDVYDDAKDLEEDGEETQETQEHDFKGDRKKYTGDAVNFAASAEMNTAIDAMEAATKEDATANDREQSMNTLIALSDQISKEITSLQNEQIKNAEEAVDRAYEHVENLENQLENAQRNNEDTTMLRNNLSNARQNYTDTVNARDMLRERLSDYQEANSKINSYKTDLGLNSETTELQISAALRSIQVGLLQRDANDEDLEALETQAVNIFEMLLSSEGSLNDENMDNNQDENMDNNQTLLTNMDRFIRDIQEYITVRNIGDQLETLISDLKDTGNVIENWKEDWEKRLNELKAQIGSLPTGEQIDSAVLIQYERTDAMSRLDNAIRLYISEHNAADQAIIYMGSPYRDLAIFSLFLAFFLDISAFVTGLLIDVAQKRKKNLLS